MATPLYLVELTAKAWPRLMRSGVPGPVGTQLIGKTQVAVSSAVTYRVTAKIRRSATADGRLYVGLALAGAPWGWIAASNVVANTTFTTYTATFGFGTANPLPGGTSLASPLVALNYNSTLGYMECVEIWIEVAAVPGVEKSADRYVRDANEWGLYSGNAPTWPTWISDNDAQAVTLRYATAAYMTWPSDTPAKTQYPARVINPGLLRSELPAGFCGPASTSYGEIVLNNTDGALGELAYYGLDGQPFRVLLGHAALDYSGFLEVLAGTMQQATVDRTQVRIRLAGRDAALDRPLLLDAYQGNNVLPNGLEGGPEMLGQAKPLLVGRALGLQPPCVNTARFIYQVTCGTVANGMPLAGVDRVWDAGVALTRGAPYANQAAMEATAPAAGQYREWLAGGCFRLGTTPAGVVTCDADATDYALGDERWRTYFHNLATYWAGMSGAEMQFAANYVSPQPDNWAGANWATLDQFRTGVWVTESTSTARDVMAAMAKAHGVWFGFAHWDGVPNSVPAKFGGEVFPPSCPAPASRASYLNLDASNCLAITGVADPGPGRGLPVWRVETTYMPNHTVLTPSMAPSVSPLALGNQGVKRLSLYVADAGILTKHAQARAVTVDTVAGDPSFQSYEATRLLALGRYPKQWFEVRVALAAVLDQSNRPRLGGYVVLGFAELRCLWQDGEVRNWGYFNVMALEINFAKNELRMTLRQATEQST